MTFLTTHLPFGPSDKTATGQHVAALPPPGSHLVITDTLKSPGYFALYHLVAAAIARKEHVTWVDLRNEGRESLEAVMRKMSVVLPTQNTCNFVHIQPSSLPLAISKDKPNLYDEENQPTLTPTYHSVTSQQTSGLVILDGLSDLLSMGFTPVEVHRFVRAVYAHVQEKTASILITALHSDHLPAGISPDQDLLERLLRMASGWWRVEGLTSGRSADVHGEISSHPLHAQNGWPNVSKAQPLQYRLESNAVKVFPKGTGRGYL